ncbi:hypothetical protein GC102_18580 [Paenibacillus sp. LMG 31460]|uniref:Uncharacterized protein n=1 Tax=Paenibacillus germinis TaxID=2654979 RepID=A0ABX1Z3D3_9BACL|nr:hypothetical protein [Paenibacillus germinis]NOU87761.1 hypothetical protein [Paenibacillus germinis]
MVDLNFASPPYAAPGGTVYVSGSYDIYYSQGNDWGTGNYNCFNVLDSLAVSYNFDSLASVGGSYWEDLHGNKVATQQARSTTGQTYISSSEDSYPNREEKVAYEVATAVLAKWTVLQNDYAVTNASVPVMSTLEAENAVPISTNSGGVYKYTDVAASGGAGMGSINSLNDAIVFQGVAGGPSLDIRYAAGSNLQLSLYINGVFSQKVNFTSTGGFSGTYNTKRVYVIIPSNSTVKLQYDTGDFIGINLDYITVGTPVNDDAAGVTYTGTWTDNNSATNRFNTDEHYTKTTGASVTFTFTGSSVTWIGVRNTNRGKANVYIDGVLQAVVDQ